MAIRIGVATSGGDAPGMNACVRALVHAAPADTTIVGIRHGGIGLLRNQSDGPDGPADYFELGPADVDDVLARPGTILRTEGSARFREYVVGDAPDDVPFTTPDSDRDDDVGKALGERAARAIEANALDGLVLIGGDTTCRAARYIYRATGEALPIAVVPATIDNDIAGTVQTIGFDSALAMAVVQADALREAAAALASTLFVLEVPGTQQGHLAVEVALATGAEAVLVPEAPLDAAAVGALVRGLLAQLRAADTGGLVVVAEGAGVPPVADGRAGLSPGQRFADHVQAAAPGAEVSVTILGHTLRGAPPTAFTRNMATRSGLRALETVLGWVRNPARRKAPVLLGMHHEGFLQQVEITGDMVRKDRARVLAVLNDQIAPLTGRR